MFNATFQRIAEEQVRQLIGGKRSTPFGDLLKLKLPAYLGGVFSLFFDPKIGGRVRLGKHEFMFHPGEEIEEHLSELRLLLKEKWELSAMDLSALLQEALELRLSFIINPAVGATQVLQRREFADPSPAARYVTAVEGMRKVMERWDSAFLRSLDAVKPYLQNMGDEPLAMDAFQQLLKSALEKEMSHDSIASVDRNLRQIKGLLTGDPDKSDQGRSDTQEAVTELLRVRGLSAWNSAIEVEAELLGEKFHIQDAIDALKRLGIFEKYNLLEAAREEMQEVDDEVDSFTQFLDEGLDL